MAANIAAPSSPALSKDSRPTRTKSRSGHKPELMVLTPQQSHTLSTSTSFSSTTSESTPATASTPATSTAAATPTAASQLSTPGPSTPHHPLRGARSGTRISSSPDPSTVVVMGASLPSASPTPAGGLGAAAAAATTGGAQFHQGTTSYGSHHSLHSLPPRPYTPATPSTPTAMQLTIPPLTPPSAAVLTSPRLEAHHHHHHHHHGSSSGGAKSPGLFPFGGTAASTQRVGSVSGASGMTGGGATTRRMPSSESSLYDPYRARQPGVSANRVKNEYQAQSPIRENYAVFSSPHPTTYASTSLGSSSEEDLHNQQYGHHKESLTEEQVFGMMIMHPPPSIGQREDYYRHSPTLTASQTLAAHYGNASTSGSSRPESPFQSSPYLPYQSYQPYSHQMPLPSPLTMESGYGLPSPMALASPGLSPFQYSGHEEVRSSEHKADPYRSAYSTARDTGSSVNAQGYGSPYLGSGGGGGLGAGPQGSPTMLNEDFSSSFESRFSSLSRGGGSSANNSRYPLHVLAGQDSNQALSSAYYEHQHVHLQQQLQKQQQKAAASAAAASATAAKSAGNRDGSDGKSGEAGSSASPGKGASAHTRHSTQHPSQPSKTDSSGTKKGKIETDEDEENEVILQKLGVISVDSSGSRSGGTRSGLTQGSGRSRRKGQWTDESEEESQERGRPRQRRSMSTRKRGGGRGGRSEDRVQCCCCSRKVCIWLSMGLLACLAVSLYFLIPRAPQFSFDSVASQSVPVVTKSRIKEQFTIQLVVDSTNNYLSLRIDQMDVTITLQSMNDGTKIADNGDLDSAFIISPKTTEMVSLPMRLDYRAASPASSTPAANSTVGVSIGNSTDVVYQQLVKACTPININNSTLSAALSSSSSSPSSSSLMASAAPGLNVAIHGQMHVWGLSWVWKPSFDIAVMNLPCPINASRNPVSELPPGPPSPPPAMASPSRAVV